MTENSDKIIIPAHHFFNQFFNTGMRKFYERVECTEQQAYWIKKLSIAIEKEMEVLRGMFTDCLKKYVVDGQPPNTDAAWRDFMEGIKGVTIPMEINKFPRQILSSVLMSTAERSALDVILVKGEEQNA